MGDGYERENSASLDYPLLHDEHEKIQIEQPRRSRVSRIKVGLCKVTFGLWFFLTTVASVHALLQFYSTSNEHHERFHIAQDITSNVPGFPENILEFRAEPRYTIDPMNATVEEEQAMIKLWNDLIPRGRGFIAVNGSSDGLPRALWDSELQEQNWAISVFHQLHCLYLTMEGYNSAMRNQTTKHTHVRHCFEYLRKSLMCYADTTLEGRDPDVQEEGDGTTGMGARHVCKNYWDVFKWAEDHRRSIKQSIG